MNATGTINVTAAPTITLGANPSVCTGVTTANLPYSNAIGRPVGDNGDINGAFSIAYQYTIDFNNAANTAGFADVPYTNLPPSPIVITVPGAAPATTYNGTLKIKNTSTLCESIGYPITVTVVANNTASAPSSTPTLCINTALSPNITHTTTGATGISNDGNATGVNGLPAGVSAHWASNTITISGTPTASGTFNYSIPLTGGCGSVNATGTIMVLGCSASSWLGLDNNWFNPSNWSNGIVPTPLTDVTVPAIGGGVLFLPVIGSGTANAHSLIINTSATLTISSGATLNINGGGVVTNHGTFINNGTFNQ